MWRGSMLISASVAPPNKTWFGLHAEWKLMPGTPPLFVFYSLRIRLSPGCQDGSTELQKHMETPAATSLPVGLCCPSGIRKQTDRPQDVLNTAVAFKRKESLVEQSSTIRSNGLLSDLIQPFYLTPRCCKHLFCPHQTSIHLARAVITKSNQWSGTQDKGLFFSNCRPGASLHEPSGMMKRSGLDARVLDPIAPASITS